jgi:hypothetical protein
MPKEAAAISKYFNGLFIFVTCPQFCLVKIVLWTISSHEMSKKIIQVITLIRQIINMAMDRSD